MIIPMLVKIDFAALGEVRRHWRGIGVTLFVNWAVKPFSMAALGWLFIGHLFRNWLPADQINSYIAGLILLAAAPCTAMVFVWSHLTKGEPHFTLSQVALNDTIMVFAFAPIVGFLLGLSAIAVPWETLVLSVVLYIVLPVIAAQILRSAAVWRLAARRCSRGSRPAAADFARRAARDTRSSVRVSGRANSAPASGHRDARRPDPDPGLSQRRHRLFPQSARRRGALRRRAVRPDRGEQLLRTRRRRRHQFCSGSTPARHWRPSSAS